MKKALSIILSLTVLLVSVFSIGFNAIAEENSIPDFNAPITEENILSLLSAYDKDGEYIINYTKILGSDSTLWYNTGEKRLDEGIMTAVHEECHGFTHLYPHYNRKQSIGSQTEEIFLGVGNTLNVKYTDFYKTEEMAKDIPEKLRTVRYDPYVAVGATTSANVSGIYGLINEYCAYCTDLNTIISLHDYYLNYAENASQWYEYENNFGNSMQAYSEFKYYILNYFLYAKQNYPELYSGFIDNGELLASYIYLTDKYDRLIQKFYDNMEIDRLLLQNKDFHSIYGGFSTGPYASAYNLLMGELEKEEYDEIEQDIATGFQNYLDSDKEPEMTYSFDGMYKYYIDNSEAVIVDCYQNRINGEILIPSYFDGYPLTKIDDDAFMSCTSLTSITIPDSVTIIDNRVFSNCTSLTSVTIPDSVTSIGDLAFYKCTSLTSITIGNSVKSIGAGAFGNTTYYNDENNWVNNVLYIDNCLIEAKDTISGNYNINADTRLIANDAFYNCSSLTSVTIPNSVTSIGEDAFFWCDSLTSVTIPDSVTSIGASAFSYCYTLTDIYYNSTIADWNKINIDEGNECLTKATIHCTDGIINEKAQPSTPSEPTEPTEPSNPTVPTQPAQPNTPTTPVPTTPTQPTANSPIQPSAQTPTITKEKVPAGAKKVNGEWVDKKQKKANIKKLTKGKKSFKATWKKVSGVKGYQLQYSTSKKFTKKTTKSVTIKKNKTTSKTVKKLKAKKKYYVRIRTYKTVNGQKVYSSWSKAKTVKTK